MKKVGFPLALRLKWKSRCKLIIDPLALVPIKVRVAWLTRQC